MDAIVGRKVVWGRHVLAHTSSHGNCCHGVFAMQTMISLCYKVLNFTWNFKHFFVCLQSWMTFNEVPEVRVGMNESYLFTRANIQTAALLSATWFSVSDVLKGDWTPRGSCCSRKIKTPTLLLSSFGRGSRVKARRHSSGTSSLCSQREDFIIQFIIPSILSQFTYFSFKFGRESDLVPLKGERLLHHRADAGNDH